MTYEDMIKRGEELMKDPEFRRENLKRALKYETTKNKSRRENKGFFVTREQRAKKEMLKRETERILRMNKVKRDAAQRASRDANNNPKRKAKRKGRIFFWSTMV